MRKRLLLVILMAVTMTVSSIAVTALPANAQYCVGNQCPSVTGNGTDFGVSDTVELTGHGFLPGTNVDFTIDNCGSTVLLGTVVADVNYEAHLSFTVPPSCCPGAHTVTLTGTGADGRPLVLTYAITVTGNGCGGTGAAGGSTTTVVGNLPRTGSNTGVPVALGVGLVAVGGALVLIARRRTSARRHNLAG